MNYSDRRLLDFINGEIKTGKTHIAIPAKLLENCSQEAINDVRDLCRINGVTMEVEV